MPKSEYSLQELLKYLNQLAAASLHRWNLPKDATVQLINVSENTTYLVEAPDDFKAILRIYRANHHTKQAIECELAWMEALKNDKVVEAPGHYLGHDGQAIQSAQIDPLETPRFMVLFHFIKGKAPDETTDFNQQFEELGVLAARMHLHVIKWQKPAKFERIVWNEKTIFGENPHWGNWRDAPGVNDLVKAVLTRVENTIQARLSVYGKNSERYGLIHADMRFANLLISEGSMRLIDFDDCGLSWFLYDFAAAISFIEDDSLVPKMKEAWLRGYKSVRKLSSEDEAEILTFVMLRRMALLAWIGSHREAPEPQAFAPHFAANTMKLGMDYLSLYQST